MTYLPPPDESRLPTPPPPSQPSMHAPGTGESEPRRPDRPRWRRPAIIGAGAVAALGLFLALRGGDDEVTIHVGMTLADLDGVEGTNGDCYGTGGYDDFGPGMDVVIRDGSGDVIGTGRTVNLDAAPQYFREELGEDLALEDRAGGLCLVVADVETKSSEFYEVSVGRRGSVTYTSDELADKGYETMLSLGSFDD
jgi:hypothetical protein